MRVVIFVTNLLSIVQLDQTLLQHIADVVIQIGGLILTMNFKVAFTEATSECLVIRHAKNVLNK